MTIVASSSAHALDSTHKWPVPVPAGITSRIADLADALNAHGFELTALAQLTGQLSRVSRCRFGPISNSLFFTLRVATTLERSFLYLSLVVKRFLPPYVCGGTTSSRFYLAGSLQFGRPSQGSLSDTRYIGLSPEMMAGLIVVSKCIVLRRGVGARCAASEARPAANVAIPLPVGRYEGRCWPRAHCSVAGSRRLHLGHNREGDDVFSFHAEG